MLSLTRQVGSCVITDLAPIRGGLDQPDIFVERGVSIRTPRSGLTHIPDWSDGRMLFTVPGGAAPMAVRSIIDYLLKQVRWGSDPV